MSNDPLSQASRAAAGLLVLGLPYLVGYQICKSNSSQLVQWVGPTNAASAVAIGTTLGGSAALCVIVGAWGALSRAASPRRQAPRRIAAPVPGARTQAVARRSSRVPSEPSR